MPRKVFSAGEILTAADVNQYLGDQTVMTFAGTAARGSAISSPTEGMVTYLADTDRFEVYGGTAVGWSSVSNFMFGTATASTGDSLVYDGTKWVNGPRSGNAIINGDFSVWQRGTAVTNLNAGQYGADRWTPNSFQDARVQRVTVASGSGPTSQFALRSSTRNSASRARVAQKIESFNAIPFRGKQITVSFWLRHSHATWVSSTGTAFGSFGATLFFNTTTTDSAIGTDIGDSAINAVIISAGSLPTVWTKYSGTVTVGSTVNNICFAFGMANDGTAANDAYWYEVTDVQLEAGPVATPFIPAGGGSKAAELALCQRYYYRLVPVADSRVAAGYNVLTTAGNYIIHFPVAMRIAPTALEQSGTATDYCIQHGNTITNLNSVATYIQGSSTNGAISAFVASGLTAGQGSILRANNTNAFLAWSAEL